MIRRKKRVVAGGSSAGKKQPESSNEDDTVPSVRPSIPATSPPHPRRPMLIISALLVVGWMSFLLAMAILAAG